MNKFMNEFNEYFLPHIFDVAYFTKKYFQQIHSMRSKNNKSGQCIFPDCDQLSIKHSHSIQKEGPLRFIAENGNLIYPQFRNSASNIDFKTIGVSKASVFPGFCKKHDDIFHLFENNKYNPEVIVVLQNFRALCREINNREIANSVLNQQKNEYYSDQIIENNRIFGNFRNDNSIKMTDYRDNIIEGFDNLITDNNNILKILNKFYTKYHDFFKTRNLDLVNIHINTDMVLPVALTGLSTIEIPISNKQIKLIVLCSILPNENGSEIFFSTLKEWGDLMSFYLKDRINHNLNILSLVESWMIYGSDNWYLNPVYCALLSTQKTK